MSQRSIQAERQASKRGESEQDPVQENENFTGGVDCGGQQTPV